MPVQASDRMSQHRLYSDPDKDGWERSECALQLLSAVFVLCCPAACALWHLPSPHS